MSILLTGASGFIGHSVTSNFLEKGTNVFGIDNLNTFYELTLKSDRFKI